MSADVARILRATADLLEPAGRWIQGSWAEDVEGYPVPLGNTSAVCWCVEGALAHVGGDGGLNAAADALERYLGRNPIAWNDDEGQTADKVIAALRAAADEVERS